MSSPGLSISQDALRRFKYYHFVRHWGKQVVYQQYRKSFLDGHAKSIHEILIDNGASFGRNRPFNSQDLTNLTGKSPEELDITAMNKICRFLWDKGVEDPGNKIKDLVKRIKEERNNVSHEETDISQMELPTKINDFLKVLEETLLEAKCYFKRRGMDTTDIEQLHSDIKSAAPILLEKIRENYDPRNPDDMQKLRQEITQYFDQLCEYIIELSQNELKAIKEVCKVLPFDWLMQYQATYPSDFITNLKMDQEKEFHGGPESSRCISVEERELFRIKDKDGKDPKVLIISGDAGSGKTTLLCSIAEKYHNGPSSGDIADLSSFQIVFYMQFRNRICGNFNDFLRNLLPQVTTLFGLEYVKASILKAKCLILCDGFDEANKNSENIFEEMLSLQFKQMKLVVTTRPSNTEKLTKVVTKAKCQRINLRILGLNADDMKDLTDKVTNMLIDDMTTREQTKKELSQAIDKMDESMRENLKIPLYFNLYILLCIECPDLWKEIRSVTTLYIQLKKHMLKRIRDRTGIHEDSLDEFEQAYTEWSLPNYISKKFELSDSDVKNLYSKIQCTEVRQHFDYIMSSYFSVKHKRSNLEIEKVFCYKHRSEQEFTVARMICEEIAKSVKNKKKNIFKSVLSSTGIVKHEQKERRTDLLPFIVGVLYNTNREALYEVISDIYRYLVFDVERNHEIDEILIPISETNCDEKVLETLVTVLESLPQAYKIRKEKSLFPLRLLLPYLNPTHGQILISLDLRTLSGLMQTVSIANKNNFHVDLYLRIDLDTLRRSLEQPLDLSNPALYVVEELCIAIYDNEEVDLSTCQFQEIPFISDQMGINVYSYYRNIREWPKMLNTIWPRRVGEEVTKKEGRNAFSLLSSKLSGMMKKKQQRTEVHYQKLKFDLEYSESDFKCTDEDIRFLFESLTVQPLTSVSLYPKLDGVTDEKSLRKLCKRKSLGDLVITDDFDHWFDC